MKKQISTIVGFSIIAVVIIILFGGVFAYEYYANYPIPMTNVQSNPNVQNSNTKTGSQQISDSEVIDAIDKLEGVQLQKNPQNGLYTVTSVKGNYTYTVISIAKGDLNEDGFQDALVLSNIVSDSGGSNQFTIVINNGNSVNAFNITPDDIITSGAGQYSIRNIAINNGLISINAGTINADGSVGPNLSFNYKLVGNNLIRTN